MRMREIIDNVQKTTLHALAEAIEVADILGTDVKLYRDPSPLQVAALVKRHERVRGVEHHGTVWMWDGYKAVHFQIIAHLGFPVQDCGEFAIQFHPENDEFPRVWLFKNAAELRQCNALLRGVAGLTGFRFIG